MALLKEVNVNLGPIEQTLASASERDTIIRVRNGDRDDFAILVRNHETRVFTMILRQVGDREVARELAQETFLRAYRGLPQFRFDSSFSTWIIRIALNLTNSYFSSRRFKESQRTLSLEEEQSSSSLTEDQNSALQSTNIAQLHSIIGSLKPKFREVLVLCGIEEKSYEEAAAILGIPIGTVRSRLNKARNMVREKYFGENR